MSIHVKLNILINELNAEWEWVVYTFCNNKYSKAYHFEIYYEQFNFKNLRNII